MSAVVPGLKNRVKGRVDQRLCKIDAIHHGTNSGAEPFDFNVAHADYSPRRTSAAMEPPSIELPPIIPPTVSMSSFAENSM